MKEEQEKELTPINKMLTTWVTDSVTSGNYDFEDLESRINTFITQEMNKRPSLSVDDIFKLLSNTKSCFCNPNHYSLKEQENIVMKDALVIKEKMYKKCNETDKLILRLKIAERALWILADRLETRCNDPTFELVFGQGSTTTDIVSECHKEAKEEILEEIERENFRMEPWTG